MIAKALVEGLLILVWFTQIIWPAYQGRPIFPLFRRKRQGKLLSELENARQDLDEDDIEEAVDQLRAAHAARHQDDKTKEETK